MIVGIGTDLVEIERIKSSIEKLGMRFIKRVLTENEIERYLSIGNKDKACAFVAKRFAAKEAASKAIGTGIGRGVSFQHFEIINLENGQPTLKVDSIVNKRLPKGASWHLSLTDEQCYAQAFVIVEAI
ncbi:holo-ACP synthase [Marinomonas sp. 15G1-11]|uniref:Holo-[acyl-carrier-protein] synthase n=1 Tax=Marinomonas phaeophyticola TaxID=3004091 RepID=A0ABT4JTY0_9GAMM|nr:holo-ACP synthase [Marinomonas sp. 15G1-11]MCZ2721676.1 holo-ACP synthase [Marinomonas sp. 15G1-11]